VYNILLLVKKYIKIIMTKNKIVLVLALLLILSPLFTVKAVEPTTADTSVTTAPQTVKDPAQEKKRLEEMKARLKIETEIMKKNLEDKKAELEKKIASTNTGKTKKLDAAPREKVQNLLKNISTKLNAKVASLTKTDYKISTKIDRLEKKGGDVAAIKAQYEIAKDLLFKANSDVLAARMTAIDQTMVETTKETMRALVKSAEESIKKAGDAYRKLLPMIAKENDKSEVEKEVKGTNTN